MVWEKHGTFVCVTEGKSGKRDEKLSGTWSHLYASQALCVHTCWILRVRQLKRSTREYIAIYKKLNLRTTTDNYRLWHKSKLDLGLLFFLKEALLSYRNEPMTGWEKFLHDCTSWGKWQMISGHWSVPCLGPRPRLLSLTYLFIPTTNHCALSKVAK